MAYTFGKYLPSDPAIALQQTGGSRVVAPQRALNNTATEARQRRAQIVAENAILPVVYGRSETGGKIFAVSNDAAGNLVLGVAWCMGPSKDIERVIVNSSVVVSGTQAITGYQVHHHYGSANQVADSWLSATVSGYADNLVYTIGGQSIPVTYSVFKITQGTQGFPRFSATIKGREVYDPRAVDANHLTEHMASPALSDRIAPFTDNYYWSAVYNDTRVFVNGVLSFTAQAYTQGTVSLTAGDLVSTDKPLALVGSTKGATALPQNATSTDFCYRLSGNYPHSQAYWCAESSTQIDICIGTGLIARGPWDFNNPATSFIANSGFSTLPGFPVYDASYTSSITVRIQADKPVCWYAEGTGGVYETLNPMGFEIFCRDHSVNPVFGDGNGTYSSGYAINAASLITMYALNDGAGADSEAGIPREMLGNRYMIPHAVRGYQIIAVEPQIVNITDNVSYATVYELTTASTTNPQVMTVGAIA